MQMQMLMHVDGHVFRPENDDPENDQERDCDCEPRRPDIHYGCPSGFVYCGDSSMTILSVSTSPRMVPSKSIS